jgi:hypothetical protein
MDVTQVQSSIEAVNRIVAMAVSRTTDMVQDQIAVNTQLKLSAPAAESSADTSSAGEQPASSSNPAHQIDMLI